jgi:uncharacterized protein YpmB
MRKFAIAILTILIFALIAFVMVSCYTAPVQVNQEQAVENVAPENKFTVISTIKISSGTLTVGYFDINPQDTIYIIEGKNQDYPVSLHVK